MSTVIPEKRKGMKANYNAILKAHRVREDQPAKWQTGLRESQELFKDKRYLKGSRTTNNQGETEIMRQKWGRE